MSQPEMSDRDRSDIDELRESIRLERLLRDTCLLPDEIRFARAITALGFRILAIEGGW